MDEIASLQLKISSIEAQLADKRLAGLERSAFRTEKATTRLTSSLVAMAGPLLAIGAATAGLTKLVNVTREFEVLNAQLITATGSADNAAIAMEAIQDFASNTPYDLQQVTEGFTKLVNLGLTPSERALTSYGDTASAMGKDLNQLIEAVADAATGEFERLKEFGIRASSQGDQVAFTFRGVTTTVQKEAGAIEEYLTQLGENNFAGAMTERMNTLDGAISNLGDEWNKLFNNISEAGVGDVIESSVRQGISVLEEMNAYLASGQLEQQLDAYAGLFEGLSKTIDKQLEEVGELFDVNTKSWLKNITGFFNAYSRMWALLPVNAEAYIKASGEWIKYFVDYAKIYAPAMVDEFVISFKELLAEAEIYGKAAANALNPFSSEDFNVDAELAVMRKTFKEQRQAIGADLEESIRKESNERDKAVDSIFKERDAAIKAFDDKIKAANDARKAYEDEAKARAASKGDRLAAFGTGAQEGEGEEDSGPNKDFEKLVKELQTEEEKIAESYKRRRQIILDNTEETSDARANLLERLNEELRENVLLDEDSPDSYDEKLQLINDFYQRRKDLILELTELTETERGALEEELEEERLNRLEQMELSRRSVILSGTADILGSAADLTKQFAGEQSGVYKALFAASKAFAIAESIVKIQQGIASAAATPFPANLAAIGSVISATTGIISTIKGTSLNFSGAYDKGGDIPQGSFGLVGEYGPELVAGPAQIVSREETAKAFKNGSGQAVNLKVDIENQIPGAEYTVQQIDEHRVKVLARQEARKVVRQEAPGVVADDLSNPNSRVSSSLERNTNTVRRRSA